MKSPTGLYCANSQKRTESLLLPSSPTIQADLSAKRPVHPTHVRWLKPCIRGQVRSYQTTCKPLKKLDFVGADLSAKRPVHPTHMRWLKPCIRGQVRSHQVCCATALRRRRGGASHSPVYGWDGGRPPKAAVSLTIESALHSSSAVCSHSHTIPARTSGRPATGSSR